MRKLVTYETITDIQPIEGADQLEKARVRGWDVVVRKGEFKTGDPVIYMEVDSQLPLDDPRFAFLASRGSKSIDGKDYHILRTAKLRGQISQGLVLPAELFPELPEITKYEPPVPANLASQIIGPYPSHLAPKTDAERIQNLGQYIDQINGLEWSATCKIDGTSTSFIRDNKGKIGLAGRNWLLNVARDERGLYALDRGIYDALWDNHTLQGEYFGEGIQKNPLGMSGRHFRAFALWDATGARPEPVPFSEWPPGLKRWQVPVLDLELPTTVEEIVAQANKLKSTLNKSKNAEGIVWHTDEPQDFLGGRTGFKAINNAYLLKHGG